MPSRPSRLQRPTLPTGSAGQRGLALIEVLVSILIFSVGVLGIVGLQTTMIQRSSDPVFRTQAVQLVGDLVAEMQVSNPATVRTAYDDGAVAFEAWKARVAASATGLPGGVGAISWDAANVATIVVTWSGPQGQGRFETATAFR